MEEPKTEVPKDILVQVRELLPKMQLTYGQARTIAEMQAKRLRTLLQYNGTRLSLEWIERIPGVTVTMLTAAEIEELTRTDSASGATAPQKDGSYKIYINENNAVTHCRFTLCHELYHVITAEFETKVFGDFGHGDPALRRKRIEAVADHFAANLLMPSSLVKKAWGYGIHGIPELAALFSVSEEAMRIRLKNVGLIRSGLTKRMLYRRPFRTLIEL